MTDRDILGLRFLTRYGYATYPQLGAYLGMGPSVVRRRMPRLAAEGLLTFGSVGKASKVWLPTSAGIRLCGLDLTVPRAAHATAAHCLALVDLGIRFEQGGELVVTERELRAADAGRLLSAPISGALAMLYPGVPLDDLNAGLGVGVRPPLFAVLMRNGKQRIHTPDMVLARPPAPDGSPGSIAIELELTRKPRSTYGGIFAAYAYCPYVAWSCTTPTNRTSPKRSRPAPRPWAWTN